MTSCTLSSLSTILWRKERAPGSVMWVGWAPPSAIMRRRECGRLGSWEKMSPPSSATWWCFCLESTVPWGEEEHRRLWCLPFDSQFSVQVDPKNGLKYVLYKEDKKCKTNQGGLSGRKFVPKDVRIYESPNVDHCPVRLNQKYTGLLPSAGWLTALYKYPLSEKRQQPSCWYTDKPVGMNTLKKVVSTLAKEAGLTGKFTTTACEPVLRHVSITKVSMNNWLRKSLVIILMPCAVTKEQT